MLLRLAYLGVTNAFALLGLLPMSDRAKDVEILALRHQIVVLERHLHGAKVRFTPADRALLAALLNQLPRGMLHQIRLLVRPDTVLRWHRDLIAARHARISRPKRFGRPPTVRSIRVLVLRLARENASWGYRRIHGELLTLRIKVAASTVWEILKEAGIDPAPDRGGQTWTAFLRSQAEVILAADLFETVTLNTDPTGDSPTPARCGYCPIRSLIKTRSRVSPFADMTASAASSMSMNRPLDLHGQTFRHPQSTTAPRHKQTAINKIEIQIL
ncbi:hypothetical protein GCM10009682_28150 [Luedemannella flava]|uniref:Integrase n=1 Tax=Luedemannella flava TaxID=349316 RepID=A0ABN2M0K3_9ACTN